VQWAGRGTSNFANSRLKSNTDALLSPVEPELNRTRPGASRSSSSRNNGWRTIQSKLVTRHESSLSNRTANWTCASSMSWFQRDAVADVKGMMMLRFSRAARSSAHSFGE
jgi:hypothetical protein